MRLGEETTQGAGGGPSGMAASGAREALARIRAGAGPLWLRLAPIVREPLFHFLVAGAALAIASHVYQSQTDLHRIVLTRAHIAQLANDYALQFGEQPDPTTLAALIRRDVHDEILYREARVEGLAQGDEIVRRRLVQKMQFVLQDLNAPAEPSQAQLQAYYDAHAAHYASPPRATFSHVFFSSDRAGDADAKARAEAALKGMSDTVARAPDKGDPFPDLYDFSAYEPEQIYRLFGHTLFAQAALTAAPGHWSGPYRSAYGWHLLYVDSRQTGGRPPLAQVQGAVRTDYLQDAQEAANAAAFARLARQYRVVRQDDRP
jgi:parvulin-like peptidyl-prolyl isomerase